MKRDPMPNAEISDITKLLRRAQWEIAQEKRRGNPKDLETSSKEKRTAP